MNGALVSSALAGFGHSRARTATEFGSIDESTLAGLGTSATGLCALAPGLEHGSTAVDGAGLGVARTRLGEGRAGLATVLGEDSALAHLLLGATATSLGAHTVATERGHLAVNRAELLTARARRSQSRALNTTVGGFLDDMAEASLTAAAAGLRAKAESTPTGDGAMHRADTSVACGGGDQGRAGRTTELGTGGNLARLELSTSAARDRAGAHSTECRNGAVNGASVGATVTGDKGVCAFLATKRRTTERSAGAELAALEERTIRRTGLGALRPGGPVGHRAVNGALLGLTLLLFLQSGTSVATVLALTNNVANTTALADAAGLAAYRPAGPTRDPAMHRADRSGAGTLLGSDWASFATITSRGKYVTDALLVAHAAGLGAGGPRPPFLH